MFNSDRLCARVNHWLLMAICGLCFLLYELLQAPFYPLSTPLMAAGIMLSAVAGVVLPLLVLTRKLGIPFRGQFQIEKPSPVVSLAVIASTLSLIPALEILTFHMARHFPPDPIYLKFVLKLTPESPVAFGLVILAVAVAVPIAEELLFRGLLQRVLLQHSAPVVAILLVAVSFGAVHPPYSIPGVIILGIFFGVMALLLENLVYPIMAHAVWNLINLIIARVSPESLGTEIETPFSQNPLLWLMISGLLFIFFSRFWLAARHRP